MKMANFLMPKSTPVADVTDEAQPDGDITRVGAVAVRRGPIGDITAVGTGALVVANHGDDSVSLLNPQTLAVFGMVALPGEPLAVTVSDDRVFVSMSSSTWDAVSVIDIRTQSIIETYSLDFSITSLAVSPDGKRVYAGRTGDGYADVAFIDTTADRVGAINIGTVAGIGVDAVEVDPTGKRLYVGVTDTHGSALLVVNAETARVEQTVRIGSPIRDIAFADDTAYVLTSDRARGGVVELIDLSANQITDTVELGIGAPTQMTLSPDQTRAYIVDYDRVVVLCTLSHQVVANVMIGARPSSVALNADGSRLHVADYTGGVTVFSVAPTMPLLDPQFMATDPIVVSELRELELTPA
jgi:YVTN family beta-propeller protein